MSALGGTTAASGRALLREVRASFYRKLFLAFLAAAVLPVMVLALATRTFFELQLESSVQSDAVRVAAVAQRVIEEYVALAGARGQRARRATTSWCGSAARSIRT